jgi:hypothetical protein
MLHSSKKQRESIDTNPELQRTALHAVAVSFDFFCTLNPERKPLAEQPVA